MKSWLFLVIAIISEIVATPAFKQSEGFTKQALWSWAMIWRFTFSRAP